MGVQRPGSFRTGSPGRRQSGAFLLEVGLVLLVVGVLTVATFQLQSTLRQRQINQDADHVLHAVDAAVRTFAVRQQRLPCPDTTGTGVEDQVGGVCGATTGGVPFFSLGMDRPPFALSRELHYGVADALFSADPASPFVTRARDASLADGASDPLVAGIDGAGYFTACDTPAFRPAYALMWTPLNAAVAVPCFRESADGQMGVLAVGRVEFLGWLQSTLVR